MTIVESIKFVLSTAKEGLTSYEIYNRILEQKLYEFGAQDPHNVVRVIIRKHCYGVDFATASVKKYFKIIGNKNNHPLYVLLDTDIIEFSNQEDLLEKEMLPEEILDKAYNEHIIALKDLLSDTIMGNSPSFFEQLIVDLLIAMGYGYNKTSGIVVGGAHDGGIDGIIYEDKLGLDRIYLQAKRYKKDNSVGRKELQAFVGAMENVQKGVFITTSTFTKEASTYAEKQQQKSLKLIDGSMLMELMIKYEVGIIRTPKKYIMYKLDNSYFA